MAKDNHHRKKPVVPEPPKLDRDEKNEKIKELIKLAKEQGYLTYGDVNDILPENILSPDELDAILHHAPRDGHRDHRRLGGRPLQARSRRGKGNGEGRFPSRHSRRPGAHVPEADGPGAAADARAGGRDFQAHRERRDRRQADHQQFRLHRQGAHRPRQAPVEPQGALRPRHHRQEDRQPRAVHARAAAIAPQVEKSDARRRCEVREGDALGPEQERETREAAPRIQEVRHRSAEVLREVLLQAEGARGICRAGQRGPREIR